MCKHTVRRQIRDTAHSVALDLDIWAEHLPNQGFKSPKLDNKELVVGYQVP